MNWLAKTVTTIIVGATTRIIVRGFWEGYDYYSDKHGYPPRPGRQGWQNPSNNTKYSEYTFKRNTREEEHSEY